MDFVPTAPDPVSSPVKDSKGRDGFSKRQGKPHLPFSKGDPSHHETCIKTTQPEQSVSEDAMENERERKEEKQARKRRLHAEPELPARRRTAICLLKLAHSWPIDQRWMQMQRPASPENVAGAAQ
jgi:hypothetical protein